MMQNSPHKLDDLDRKIITATQNGLPLVPKPFDVVAKQVDAPATEVRMRLHRMLDQGIIRRIGAVPNHYALGVSANGMSVWDVRDDAIDKLGKQVGELAFVSHCYSRPRHLPVWPYNLFAMVHGRKRSEVEDKVATIARLLGEASARHDILYSTRILKKTGLRIAA
jgi:DNA-binding Lrp family transcriptional regulator